MRWQNRRPEVRGKQIKMTAAAGPGSWIGLALLCVASGVLLTLLTLRLLAGINDRQQARQARAQLAGAVDALWTTDARLQVTTLADAALRPLSTPPVGRPLWQWLDHNAALPATLDNAMRLGTAFEWVLLVGGAAARTSGQHTRPGHGADTPRADQVALLEVVRCALNGEVPPVMAISGRPQHDASGRIAGWCGSARAIGPLLVDCARAATQNGDEQSQRMQALQAQYAERSRQFDFVVKELDSFAHSVSHDLRAPLRVVDGFATIVLEDYGSRLDDLGREHLKRIVAAAGRMNAMIDTLLALSRTTSRALERERVDLSRLAAELADELQADDRSRSVTFVIATGLYADGDRTLLRLVLQNLLSNAFKFTARTGAARIEFGCRAASPRTLTPGHGGLPVDTATLAPIWFVRDNGAGFDMRFADKLFGVFQRLHSQSEFPGTGVGLATVQRILRSHGGRIWAQAEPGKGAEFCFTLWENGSPL